MFSKGCDPEKQSVRFKGEGGGDRKEALGPVPSLVSLAELLSFEMRCERCSRAGELPASEQGSSPRQLE